MADETVKDAVLAAQPQPASQARGAAGQDKAALAVRRTQAVAFRLSGLTYEQIATKLQYTDRSAARQAVLAALREVQAEEVNELREVENARLERANAAIWPKVLAGDVKALLAWIRLSERRARLNGLDAPTRVALSAGVAVELQEALELLGSVVLGDVVGSRDDGD